MSEPEEILAAQGEQASAPAASPRGPAAPVGHVAIRGLVWSTAFALATKVVSIAQQFIIARFFLSDADFGLVAMAQVVLSFTSIGQNLGLSEIMARRHRTFERWAQASLWMSLAGSLLCIGLIMAIIPFWERIYVTVSSALSHVPHATPHIEGLLAVWCLGLPFDAVATIFNARLRSDMRFRTWAVITSIQTLGIAALSIVLASLGWGAYSLIVPVPIMMCVCCLLSCHCSRQRMGLQPDFRRWGLLLKEARYYFVGTQFMVLLQQGDFLTTGLFFPQAILGAYYFAFRMSSQTGQLIGANVISVLLPSFARLDKERERQIAAYERTCAVLLLIAIPLCCLQALLAQPLFEILFGRKWETAWPLFESLSLAMGFAMPMGTAMSLLLAQGRLRMNMILTIVQAILFVSFVLTGALCGSVTAVAGFVALFYLLLGPLTSILPVVGSGVSPAAFLYRVYRFPVIAGVAAADAGYVLTNQLHPHSMWIVLLLRSGAWLIVMALCLLAFRPAAAKELAPRVAGLLARLGVIKRRVA